MALGYVHYNLCHVVKTFRVTPALAAGVTSHVWELEELMAALVSTPKTEAPSAQPFLATTLRRVSTPCRSMDRVPTSARSPLPAWAPLELRAHDSRTT